jgi:magnesium transporter
MSSKSHHKPAEERLTKHVPTALSEDTLGDIKQALSKNAAQFTTINYIYVLDENTKLTGVFSIKDLFIKPENLKAKEVMKTSLIKAHSFDDQERIAILALKNNLKAIPLVDKENKFLGVVPSDAILGILHFEHVEDFLRSAGIHSAVRETFEGTSVFLAKARIPWLIFGLMGGIVAAAVVEFFEAPLKAHFVLAAFIPLMVYMADAVGAQTQMLFIRNLIFENRVELGRYILKEIKIGIIIAVILGILLSVFSLIWFKASYSIGLILGVSLLLTVLGAMMVGVFIPWLLWKFKKDPAIGAGPFGTIIRDLLSLIIYFGVASFFLWLTQ